MQTTYKHFTEEQREQARRTDLVYFLRSRGEKLKRSGSEYEWKDGSQKVTVRGNLWYHQYEQTGGDAIDFVRKFYGKNYPEAVEYLLGGACGTLITAQQTEREIKPFELPSQNESMHRVFSYLHMKRGIDRDVLLSFIRKGMIYESRQYHNAVFVGHDKSGIPRHAHKRSSGSGSSYKGNAAGSLPEYSFHWYGSSEKIYLFEAPIDMLSYISMNKGNWQAHSYAAACSVSDRVLFHSLTEHTHLQKVYLCLDHDEAGQKANKRIADRLTEQGAEYEILVPIHKDWNEDLLYLRAMNEKSEMESSQNEERKTAEQTETATEAEWETEESSCQILQP
ncbi:MAG: DUF3991 domain-containing protein [Bacteroides sp.]|nr:DUF3991 domain-containing protein [Bacteroides sp.]MCM1548845.1 DUF3991 domain-containing protein [Clostridium sp.]